MCVETDFTMFALGRCMLAVESGARKLLVQIVELKFDEYKPVDHSERYLDQIDDLREQYTQLLANVLELVRDKRDSEEHRETAKRIETVFDQCRKELLKKNCAKFTMDKVRDDAFKEIPIFFGDCSKWVEFRKDFSKRVLHNSGLNKHEKIAIFMNKVSKGIRIDISAAESLEVQWRMLCNKYDTPAAEHHVSELFRFDSSQDECHRHVNALKVLGFKCDPLSEMLIGRLIQWRTPNANEPKYSKSLLSWSKVNTKLLKIVHDQCYLCKGKHVLRMCNEFKQLPFEKRIEEVQRLNVCLICFSWNHTHANCSNNHGCLKCRGKHNTAIHPEDNDVKKLKELEKLVA